MNQNKRLYLNSVDSNEINNKFEFEVGKADLHTPSGSRMKIKMVRAVLPSTLNIGSYNENTTADDFNLRLSYEHTTATGTTGYAILFNPQFVPTVTTRNLNLQTTMVDLVSFINLEINSSVTSPTIAIDTNVAVIGLNRLNCVNDNETVTFLTGTSSIEILRALGCRLELNTSITRDDSTPFNFDITQVMQNVLINSNINTDSFSTTSIAKRNILESIPTALTQAVNYNELLSTIQVTGTVNKIASFKNASSLIYEGTNNGLSIGNTSIDTIVLSLLSPQNKIVNLGGNKMSIVLEIEFVK